MTKRILSRILLSSKSLVGSPATISTEVLHDLAHQTLLQKEYEHQNVNESREQESQSWDYIDPVVYEIPGPHPKELRPPGLWKVEVGSAAITGSLVVPVLFVSRVFEGSVMSMETQKSWTISKVSKESSKSSTEIGHTKTAFPHIAIRQSAPACMCIGIRGPPHRFVGISESTMSKVDESDYKFWEYESEALRIALKSKNEPDGQTRLG